MSETTTRQRGSPCCRCGTTEGATQGLARYRRLSILKFGGPPGRACLACFNALKGLEPRPPGWLRTFAVESDMTGRVWKRARAARILGEAERLGIPWRLARASINLSQTTEARRNHP